MSTVRRTDAPRRPAPVTSEILDRKPPFDLDAELAVIGSMMLLQDVTDDLSKTLLVGESSVAVPWTKPVEIPFNPETPLPLSGSGLGFLMQMGLCDGSTRGVLSRHREGVPPADDPLRGLITRSAGDRTDLLD